MALPVKPSDWQSIIASTGASLCTRLKLLLNNIGQYLYNYMSWMWQEDGELTDEAAEVISRKVSGVRSGTIMFMAVPQSSIPSGYLLCDGRSLDKTVTGYADLYVAIGTRWGGDGDPNFNIPNLLEDIPYGAKDDTELGQEVERVFLSHSDDIFVATGTKNITITDFITLNDIPYLSSSNEFNISTSVVQEMSHADGTLSGAVLTIPHGLNFSKLDIRAFLVITTGDNGHGIDVGDEYEITSFPWLILTGESYYFDGGLVGSGRVDYAVNDVYFPHATWQTWVSNWGYGPGLSALEGIVQKTDTLIKVTHDGTNVYLYNPYKDFRFMLERANAQLIAYTPDWPKIEADLRIEITNKSLFDNAYSLLTTHGLTPVIKL